MDPGKSLKLDVPNTSGANDETPFTIRRSILMENIRGIYPKCDRIPTDSLAYIARIKKIKTRCKILRS